MSRREFLVMPVLCVIVSVAGCAGPKNTPTPSAGMANPASVFCEQNGGKLDIRPDSSGGQVGYCVFPDGSECEEWAYFRGECKPKSAPVK